MQISVERIKQLAKEYFSEIQAIRRHLHIHPELSMQEHATSAFIRQNLENWGIPYKAGIAGTGVVAVLTGEKPGSKVFALRADMDALPIEEAGQAPYKSINQGTMHACGHDAHMACLLGAARILQATSPHWGGTLKLVFQPSEESVPGGASLMIKEGILENPRVDGIAGQHVAPMIPVGKIGVRNGIYMASADEIYLKVIGKGGHGAMPQNIIDPVLIASHIIVGLQQIVSRNGTPWIPSVLSFGKISADGRTNVIPSEVKIEGTFRTFNEEWRALAHEKIEAIAKGIARSMGGDCDVNILKGYPFLINHASLTNNFRKYAAEYAGSENLVELELSMTSEDFAWYSQQVPACFYRLGTRNEKLGVVSNIHTPTFDIDESALETGSGLMAWFALCELTGS